MLCGVSAFIGVMASLLATLLKHLTEHYEERLFARAGVQPLLYLLFPAIGLVLIFLLRSYVFRRKENRGIKEVLDSTKSGRRIPSYKIASHFVNGLLTVSFGGSTGIEVSTVVSSAAIGSLAQQRQPLFRKYGTELICAGIAAGVTALFASPLAGLFFAWEVIYKRTGKMFIATVVPAVATATLFLELLGEVPVFSLHITQWHLYALPYFILLGVVCGINGVYLTRCILFIKSVFAKIKASHYRIALAALIIGLMVMALPQLYGDGYHALKHFFAGANTMAYSPLLVLSLLGIILLKPVITSVTLSGGGDGGVFAPGLFIGAFLGLLIALVLNTFFDAGVIPLNFMAAGMAAMLSASIHAPLTALFLTCSLSGGYTLFVPLLTATLVARYTAKTIYPYNVYTYPVAAYASQKD